MPENAFFLIPLLYGLGVLALIGVSIAALWRTMRAQEATAEALVRIAQAVSRFEPPA